MPRGTEVPVRRAGSALTNHYERNSKREKGKKPLRMNASVKVSL